MTTTVIPSLRLSSPPAPPRPPIHSVFFSHTSSPPPPPSEGGYVVKAPCSDNRHFWPYVGLTSSSGSQQVTLVNFHSTAWWDFLPLFLQSAQAQSLDGLGGRLLPALCPQWSYCGWLVAVASSHHSKQASAKTMLLSRGIRGGLIHYILWNKSLSARWEGVSERNGVNEITAKEG